MVSATVQTGLRDVLTAIQDWLAGLSTTDWILLAFAAGAVYWVAASAWAATRPGPIEIEPVKHDRGTDEDALVNERTSFLRERIADAGLLPPPGVPGGAPQRDLLAAVEKSPLPDANWIATLLRLVPWPSQTRYSLVTTLLEAPGPKCGARVWLRSSGQGAPLLSTLEDATVDKALARVPGAVFAQVSNDAVHAFPVWARWEDEANLRPYLEGIQKAKEGDEDAAYSAFERARDAQPTNALVRLRLINLDEVRASTKPLPDRTLAQAQALRRYLDLSLERPELVEARYRASVLAGRVADELGGAPPPGPPPPPTAVQQQVLAELRLDDTDVDDLVPTLQDVAARELDSAIRLVAPWFALLVWRRLRYTVEPKGYDRRRLKRTFVIARHTQFVRRLPDRDTPRTRLLVWLHSRAVEVAAGRATAGWQAYYGGACYFALLEARRQRMETADGR